MERVVYAITVEGMLVHGPGRRLTVADRDDLKAYGIDLSGPLRASYPEAQWLGLVGFLAGRLLPELSLGEACLKMGEEMVLGAMKTLLGRAVWATVQLVGTRRTLLRLERSIRTGCNFVTVETQEVRAGCIDFAVRDYLAPPELMQGSILGVACLSGAKNPKVDFVSVDAEGGTAEKTYRFRATWDV